MYFDYEPYRASCIVAPGIGVLCFSIGFLGALWGIVRLVLKRQWFWKEIAKYSFFTLFMGLILCIDSGVLLHGGIHLYYEKETDAVEMQGEISDIRGLGLFSFPRVDCNYEYGVFRGYEFTIDDVRCTAVVKGSLEVGDYVTVKYLPKSGYILYIAETEEESTDIE